MRWWLTLFGLALTAGSSALLAYLGLWGLGSGYGRLVWNAPWMETAARWAIGAFVAGSTLQLLGHLLP